MKIAIIDYETGNLKSVSKALELASNNVLKRSNIEIINSAKDLNNFLKINVKVLSRTRRTNWLHEECILFTIM